jgi:hypothetical protein
MEQIQALTKLMVKEDVKHHSGDKHWGMYLPIESLCDINVKCRIEKRHGRYYFEITADGVVRIDDGGDCQTTNIHLHMEEKPLGMAIYIIEKLPLLRFNKINSKLVTDDITEDEMVTIFKEISLPNGKYTFSECCVCLETTKHKTSCGHHLCVPCWSKIKEKYCEECVNDRCLDCNCEMNECGFKPCPICRQSIEHEM